MQPARPPIGLRLSQVARAVSRAFDAALAEAGGSVPIWLILLNLKIRPAANQRQLAEAIGIRDATLTHHLNAMDQQGLITRRRDPANRRTHVLELTEAGEAAFHRLRRAAVGFDQQLREGIPDAELRRLEDVLERLRRNVRGEDDPGPAAAEAGEVG